MSAENSKKELFENVPVTKALLTLSMPTIISQLINLIYNLADTFYVGRTGNPFMMAGVSLAFTLFMMNMAFSNLFGIGGGSMMARLLGKNEAEQARKVSAFSIYCALALALVYSVLIGIFMTPILTLFGASEATMPYARQYTLLVVVFGGIPNLLAPVISHILRNAGYSRQAGFGLSGGGILNIILDPIFMFLVFPKGQEVFGAALATLISNIVSAVYLIIVMIRVSRTAPISVDFREIRGIRSEDVKGIFSVGIPSALLSGLYDVVNVVLNARMAMHGDLQVAAIGIVLKIERLPNCIGLGISQGMMPLVAYNFTSGDHARMKEVISRTRVIGTVTALVAMIFYLIFARPLCSLFISTGAADAAAAALTLGYATGFLRVRTLGSPLVFLNYSTSFCLQGMGDGRGTLIHAVGRHGLIYIPSMILFDILWGATGLSVAHVFAQAGGAVLAFYLLDKWMKKNAI